MAAGRAAGRAVAGLWRAASASGATGASGAAGAAGARLTTDRSLGPPRVVFLGPPGVGKGTYAGRVAAKVRWCRWPLRVQKAGQELD